MASPSTPAAGSTPPQPPPSVTYGGVAGLTPEAIMLMVRRQLDEMDGQIQSSIGAIEDRRAESNGIGAEIAELRELDRMLRQAGDMVDGGEARLGRINNDVDGTGSPGEENLRRFLGIDGPMSDDDRKGQFRGIMSRQYGLDVTGNSMDMTMIDQKISELSEEQRRINSGNEMTMMQLQSAMQMRSQIIQLGSNMLKSGGDAAGTIIGNVR